MLIDRSQAWQFAIMLQAGMPAEEIIVYFFPDADQHSLTKVLQSWLGSKVLREAVEELQGGEWAKLSAEERMQKAIDKHYAELGYLLYSRNYITAQGLDKTKLDTARSVLEAKLAGVAGQATPMERFWDDMRAKAAKEAKDRASEQLGTLSLPTPPVPLLTS